MGLQEIVMAIYCVIAVWAMVMTVAEQRAKGQTNLAYNLAGILACAVWPVTVVFLLLPEWRTITHQVSHSSDA